MILDTLNVDYLLGFTDSLALENNIVFYKNPYILYNDEYSKIALDSTYFFDRKMLSLSHNKEFFTITAYQFDSINNKINNTVCFLINIEQSKIKLKQQGACYGKWRGNNWYYIEEAIYFNSEYYQNSLKIETVDNPISISNINFIKTETLQMNKDEDKIGYYDNKWVESITFEDIIVGYKDSVTFHIRDSKEILHLYNKPYLIKGEECFKIKNYNEDFAGSLLSISPNGRFLLMSALDIGYVDIGNGEPPLLHDKYYCLIIDIERNKVIQQMSSACGGEWDKNNHWVDTKTSIIYTKKLE